MDAAHVDPRVVAIVDDLIAINNAVLVKLAKKALLGEFQPTAKAIDGMLGMARLTQPGLIDGARRVLQNGLDIAKDPNIDHRKRCRGAVLELLVLRLVGQRIPGALREQCVELTVQTRSRKNWTYSKEVVADGGTFEVYECKRTPGGANRGLNQDDINELGDIQETGEAAGRDTRTTVAFLESYTALDAALRRLVIDTTLYYVTEAEVLRLGTEPPNLVAA